MNQPQQPQIQVLYANTFSVLSYGPEDFYVECGIAENEQNASRVARIIVPPAAAKRLMQRLQTAIAEYEESSGAEIWAGDPEAPLPARSMSRNSPAKMKKRTK